MAFRNLKRLAHNARTEYEWDKKLKIHTCGHVYNREDDTHYAYEPTPYTVLERLKESQWIRPEDRVVDYGSGKGRVGFYLNHEIGCRVTGVEFNPDVYRKALDNLASFPARDKGIEFLCQKAEEYSVEDQDIFYFFNPFSVLILQKVLGRIRESIYVDPRPVRLFFYYPGDEYLAYLMTLPDALFVDEIDCQDLFPGKNSRERILVFEM